MSVFIETKETDVALLCGGLGRRLLPVVSDRHKSMAEVGSRPFLDIIIDYTVSFGFRRFILCTGYRGNEIREYYQKKPKRDLEILFSEEKEPLNTAGAIKNAEPFIRSPEFLVMNGDSFCRVPLKKFIQFHLDNSALISLVLTRTEERGEYGNVSLTNSGRIVGFREKSDKTKNGLVNAGIYLLRREALSLIPRHKKFSLEEDFFPEMVSREMYGYIIDEAFIDIGTPQRYKKAQKALTRKDF